MSRHHRRPRMPDFHCAVCSRPILGNQVSIIAIGNGQSWIGHRKCLLPIAEKHGIEERMIEVDE